MRLEHCIRRWLGLSAHRVGRVEEADGALIAEVEAMEGRLLRTPSTTDEGPDAETAVARLEDTTSGSGDRLHPASSGLPGVRCARGTSPVGYSLVARHEVACTGRGGTGPTDGPLDGGEPVRSSLEDRGRHHSTRRGMGPEPTAQTSAADSWDR